MIKMMPWTERLVLHMKYPIDSLTCESTVHLPRTATLCVSLQPHRLSTASFQVQRLLSHYLITTLTRTLSGKKNCYFQSVGKIPRTHTNCKRHVSMFTPRETLAEHR